MSTTHRSLLIAVKRYGKPLFVVVVVILQTDKYILGEDWWRSYSYRKPSWENYRKQVRASKQHNSKYSSMFVLKYSSIKICYLLKCRQAKANCVPGYGNRCQSSSVWQIMYPTREGWGKGLFILVGSLFMTNFAYTAFAIKLQPEVNRLYPDHIYGLLYLQLIFFFSKNKFSRVTLFSRVKGFRVLFSKHLYLSSLNAQEEMLLEVSHYWVLSLPFLLVWPSNQKPFCLFDRLTRSPFACLTV